MATSLAGQNKFRLLYNNTSEYSALFSVSQSFEAPNHLGKEINSNPMIIHLLLECKGCLHDPIEMSLS